MIQPLTLVVAALMVMPGAFGAASTAAATPHRCRQTRWRGLLMAYE